MLDDKPHDNDDDEDPDPGQGNGGNQSNHAGSSTTTPQAPTGAENQDADQSRSGQTKPANQA